tara:strand:- start:230 stop:457 length:228 start_codon:yes stop_codon:yes gene_type:complete
LLVLTYFIQLVREVGKIRDHGAEDLLLESWMREGNVYIKRYLLRSSSILLIIYNIIFISSNNNLQPTNQIKYQNV